MITAQFLYDLRTLTGFCSGTDLHDLFRAILNDPSPSGRREINLNKALVKSPELQAIINDPDWWVKAEEYSGASFPYRYRRPIRECDESRFPEFVQRAVHQLESDA